MSSRRNIASLSICLLSLLAPVSSALSQGEFKAKVCVWEWVDGVYVETCRTSEVIGGSGETGPHPGTNALRPNDLVHDMIQSGKYTNEQILILEGFNLKAF